jgi:hypothetical protein
VVPLREEQQYLDDVEDEEVEFARACPSTRSGPTSSCLDEWFLLLSTAYYRYYQYLSWGASVRNPK